MLLFAARVESEVAVAGGERQAVGGGAEWGRLEDAGQLNAALGDQTGRVALGSWVVGRQAETGLESVGELGRGRAEIRTVA